MIFGVLCFSFDILHSLRCVHASSSICQYCDFSCPCLTCLSLGGPSRMCVSGVTCFWVRDRRVTWVLVVVLSGSRVKARLHLRRDRLFGLSSKNILTWHDWTLVKIQGRTWTGGGGVSRSFGISFWWLPVGFDNRRHCINSAVLEGSRHDHYHYTEHKSKKHKKYLGIMLTSALSLGGRGVLVSNTGSH